MIEKIPPKESEKKVCVPGCIYVVNSDTRSEQGEVLKAGSPVQVLQQPKQDMAVVKDFRGVQWEADPWQLSKEAIQGTPTRGRIWLSRAQIRLYAFFNAVDQRSEFIVGLIIFLLICTSLFCLFAANTGIALNPLLPIVFVFCLSFILLLAFLSDNIALRLSPHAGNYLCKKENLQELEVLLGMQKTNVGKELKNDQ